MIIIDGHNLIGAMPNIDLSDTKCKDKLLKLLTEFQYIINERIIIVFDGSDILESENYTKGKLEIKYPSKDNDADDVIKQLIKKYTNHTAVKLVTSDNELKSLAKKRGLILRSSKQFAQEIQDIISRSQLNTEKFLEPVNTEEWMKYFNKTKSKV